MRKNITETCITQELNENSSEELTDLELLLVVGGAYATKKHCPPGSIPQAVPDAVYMGRF